MIISKNYYHDWQMGRTVARYNFSGDPKGQFIIANISPQCIILDDHSKWCRTGVREGQNWDGSFHGYIEVLLTQDEKTRSSILTRIGLVNWDTIDISILRKFKEILDGA